LEKTLVKYSPLPPSTRGEKKKNPPPRGGKEEKSSSTRGEIGKTLSNEENRKTLLPLGGKENYF
jgi:hypothetical protein